MDFQLTEEQRLVQETARDFVDRELIPHVREWEAKGEVPKAFYHKMADLGFLGAPVPEKYGGAGRGYGPVLVLRGEMGRGASPGLAVGSLQNPPPGASRLWVRSRARKPSCARSPRQS